MVPAKRRFAMWVRVMVLGVALGLSGCISLFSGGGEPQHTTVVVPPGSTVTCTGATPCVAQ
jgi:hypothetical protein